MHVRILIILLVFWASPAPANPWTIVDLGRLYKSHHCLEAARKTFSSILVEAGGDRVWASDWVAYATGLRGRHDALISCTYGDNRGTRATLVLHTDARHDTLLVRRIVQVFNGHAETITEAWKRSFD